LRAALDRAPSGDPTTALVAERVDQLAAAIDRWKAPIARRAELRLFPLAEFMVDVYAGALLLEQAGYEQRELGRRKGSSRASTPVGDSPTSGPSAASTNHVARSSTASRSVTARSSRPRH